MFSSCLKNIEPEGLADLRGAKAELLRAKTALEEANAAKVNAEAAFVQAQAKIQEAIAKQEEAKAAYEAAVARLKELEVEKQTALDQIEIEKAIAEAQAEIAEAEALAAVYAAQLERDLLYVQAEIAKNQAALEEALKDLAIAKNTLTLEQRNAIASLELAVTTARNDVETKTKALEAAAKSLADLLAEVDEAKINKAIFARVERAIVVSNAALEAAKKVEAEAKAALELDPSVTDWEAKAEAYKAELDKLESERIKRIGEIEEAMATMRDSADTYMYEMAEDYTAYTGYPFNAETGFFSKIYDEATHQEFFDIPEIFVASTDPIVEDFKIVDSKYKVGFEEEAIASLFDEPLADYAFATRFVEFLAEMLQENLKNLEVEGYKEVLDEHADLVDAVKTGDYLKFFNKYVYVEEEGYPADYSFEERVADYNTALAAFEAAVKTYNDEIVKATVDEKKVAEINLKKVNDDNAAAAELYKNYQSYEDKLREATKVYYQAFLVNEAAKDDRDAKVEAAEKAAEAEYDDMKAFLAAYDEATATDEAKATALTYKAAVKTIEDAMVAYDDAAIDTTDDLKTDPASVFAAADAVYTEAYAKYKYDDDGVIDTDDGTAYIEAYAAYNKKLADNVEAYNNAMIQLSLNTPSLNVEYVNYLEGIITAASNDLNDAMSLNADVEDIWRPVDTFVDVEYELEGGLPSVKFIDVVDYFVGEDGKLIPVDVKTLADSDMWSGRVTQNAIYLSGFTIEYEAGGYDNADMYVLTSEGFPQQLLSYEDFVEIVETLADDREIYTIYNDNSSPVIEYYEQKYMFESMLKTISDLKSDAVKSYFAGIEAAKAEVEALMAENTAKLAADKAEIEAFYAKYLEAEDKYDTEREAFMEKWNVVNVRYTAMIELIGAYCSFTADDMSVTDVDALKAALQNNYEAAVETVIAAEDAVVRAEKTLADLKAGVVSAADAAQRAYDRAAEELAVAISKLEKATAALENIIAAIYETGEVPETPETPETPEGGDNTTEGGDDTTEGGEETPAE